MLPLNRRYLWNKNRNPHLMSHRRKNAHYHPLHRPFTLKQLDSRSLSSGGREKPNKLDKTILYCYLIFDFNSILWEGGKNDEKRIIDVNGQTCFDLHIGRSIPGTGHQ